jgi:hypothetical protein
MIEREEGLKGTRQDEEEGKGKGKVMRLGSEAEGAMPAQAVFATAAADQSLRTWSKYHNE